MNDQNELIMITQNQNKSFLLQKLEKDDDRRFLANYIIKNNEVIFNKYYSINLPRIYNEKYFGQFLTINYSKYPYFIFNLDNKIYDIEKNKNISIIDDNDYFNSIDFNSKHNYTIQESFKIFSVDVDSNKNIHLTYTFNDELFYGIYDKNLQLKRKSQLNNYKKYLDITYIGLNLYKGIIEFYGIKNDESQILKIPLSFIN